MLWKLPALLAHSPTLRCSAMHCTDWTGSRCQCEASTVPRSTTQPPLCPGSCNFRTAPHHSAARWTVLEGTYCALRKRIVQSRDALHRL
jgi:hypothetical protein